MYFFCNYIGYYKTYKFVMIIEADTALATLAVCFYPE